MIFDAHSDILYGLIQQTEPQLLSTLDESDGAILNYYFKGSENYNHFLFVLQKIAMMKEKIPPFYVLGIEGLGPMSSLDDFHLIKQAGIRSIMLTWNDENIWGTGVGGNPRHGLKKKGKQLLKKMEEEGFYLDVSHANEKTFWEELRHFHGKIFASHSNCKALCDHPRNLSDSQILAIAARGGVIGVNAYAPFVGKEKDVDSYIDHLEYIKHLAGSKVPCFGFDFDDYLSKVPSTIDGLPSKKAIPFLLQRLKERGWSEEEIAQVSYQNISRFLHL